MTRKLLLQIPNEKRLSLSLKKPNHFGACVTEEQQSIAAKGVVPVDTKVANDWVLRNLRQWMDHRRNCGEEQVPGDLLQDLLLTVCFVCFSSIIVSCRCSFSFLMAFCIDGYSQTAILCSCFNSQFNAARKNCVLCYRVLYGN